MPGMTIDNFDPRIYFDYIQKLQTIENVKPLYKSEEGVYVPAKAIVHTSMPWALFVPPENYPLQIGPLFSPYQIIPSFSFISTSVVQDQYLEGISCDTEEEEEEKEVIRRCIGKIKELKALLLSIGQQSGQMAYGPLEILETIARDEAKRTPPKEARQIAYTFVRQGKYRSAIPYLESLVEGPNPMQQDLETLGALYVHTYHPELAIPILEKAVEHNSENHISLLNLSKALFDTHQYSKGFKIVSELQNDVDPYIAQNAQLLLQQFEGKNKEEKMYNDLF